MVHSAEPHETRRFTADEVMRMVEVGLLHADEHVELIDGELVVVNPQGPVHSELASRLHSVLARAYGEGHQVRSHSPVRGGVDSIPEPDVAVARGARGAFLARLPGPDDVPLVVEIAYSSLSYDRAKARVYASAGYGTYWLLDIEARKLEVRTEPQPEGYAKTTVHGDDADVAPPGSGASVRVADLLP